MGLFGFEDTDRRDFRYIERWTDEIYNYLQDMMFHPQPKKPELDLGAVGSVQPTSDHKRASLTQ